MDAGTPGQPGGLGNLALGHGRRPDGDRARPGVDGGGSLAAISTGYQEPSPNIELVRAVLAHPAVPEGVVARYATARDRSIRLITAKHPSCSGTALDVLRADPDAEVRDAATSRARER